MSAFTHIVTDWAPLVGGLCGFAAFSEMLWRKLVVDPRSARFLRAATGELRGIRAATRGVAASTEATRQTSSRGGPNAR